MRMGNERICKTEKAILTDVGGRLLWVVMADDNLQDHTLAKKAMAECGLNHILTSVFNGEQLVDLLMNRGIYRTDYKKPPDGLIINTGMQVMNGIDALSSIKTRLVELEIPIFLLGSPGTFTDKSLLSGLNIQASFQKPLHLNAMKKMILGLCRSVHAHWQSNQKKT
jgi:CheY-like chemotaxis protein